MLLFRTLKQWEWHALVVWGVLAAVLLPLLAKYLRRGLVLLMRRNRALLRGSAALAPAEAAKEL